MNIPDRHSVTTPLHKQSGAALMVSLMLIFTMSLLGISAMRSGSLNSRMVTNALEKDLTLQVSESASDIALADQVALVGAVCSPTAIPVDVTELDEANVITSVATVTYEGQTIAPGWSSGLVSAIRYTASATSTLAASGTNTQTSQGTYYIVPKDSSGAC